MNRIFRWAGVGVMLLALYGCATAVSSGYGQGGQSSDGRSYAEARADNHITAAVNTLLVRDKRIAAMDVRVSTYDGVVTLAGQVPSHSASRLAEQLAASVEGVERVDNRLRVGR